jgi:hypothetical protein
MFDSTEISLLMPPFYAVMLGMMMNVKIWWFSPLIYPDLQ